MFLVIDADHREVKGLFARLEMAGKFASRYADTIFIINDTTGDIYDETGEFFATVWQVDDMTANLPDDERIYELSCAGLWRPERLTYDECIALALREVEW